jgi:ACS family tartrate transporter-like MFS transporter
MAVLLTLIPFGLAAAATLAIGHSSEKTRERRLHIGLPLLAGGAAFAAMPLFLRLQQLVPAFACVVVAVAAADATTGELVKVTSGGGAEGDCLSVSYVRSEPL